MTTNTKTPAMLLQEFTVKKKFSPPEYNLIVSKEGTHQNEFHYKVSVANIDAIGMGRSKQVAKHDAAFKAIELLTKMGVYIVEGAPLSDFNPKMHRNEPDHPFQAVVNCIGNLQEICCENKLPPPQFIEISDIGPPHCRQFTYECQLSSIKTQATANTKKQAKQIAAKLMTDRITDIIPQLAVESENYRNAITSQDDDVKDLYSKLSFFNVIPNKSAKVTEFPYCFIKLMEERDLNFDSFIDYFKLKTEDNMKKILEKLDLEYQFVPIQEVPDTVVILNVSTDTPFSVLGLGPSFDYAKNCAIKEAFVMLETYMTVKKLVW
ncbi:hypothetical protein HHI36_019365 [Cryptolaemus montrouzieri]|uniref:DRBM domain-containing protein n=1 Tax=Cryptolaemus montrouzieri TaxID=559131 RepID=A0ABD2P391_9CUCU